MDERKQVFTRRFKIGIVLITGSMLCGYASLAALGGAAGAHNPWLRDLSVTIWLLTWIPFFAGLAISGKDGLQYAKDIIKRQFSDSEWFHSWRPFFSGLTPNVREDLRHVRDLIKKWV
ncbi:MAG: hypothetical protein A3C38_00180 [Planctomycetes bacterium RIFCSPHIGHO2_02_FULL_50_42]|nr:MAG: hypothetical protein A2060_01260 [Planctomycetes bacterium GWA2_50_13]OHB88267.1 MAG: hypothetical protein A3C38_00180 [Planctomycetes bacterium RIFCSPHIGHO2_02_FULL_50_42]OHB95091.1 MAG: hypothetical protein A3I59_03265 [Planctomycetes bacterium RIFCSPLOWO2_02_FULL_50_16]